MIFICNVSWWRWVEKEGAEERGEEEGGEGGGGGIGGWVEGGRRGENGMYVGVVFTWDG